MHPLYDKSNIICVLINIKAWDDLRAEYIDKLFSKK